VITIRSETITQAFVVYNCSVHREHSTLVTKRRLYSKQTKVRVATKCEEIARKCQKWTDHVDGHGRGRGPGKYDVLFVDEWLID
jgi:hypothetical protein